MPNMVPERKSPERTAPSSIHPPIISLPKGGGAIRGIGEKFAANPVTGSGSLQVPIATSPGRAGLGPQLTLAYDSGAGNGPFGFGWHLSFPSITRKTDKGLPRYLDDDESDVFILSGAEDLVPVDEKPRTIDGVLFRVRRYRPRIEGLFARIERWTNSNTGETHWRSISPSNVTTLYGQTAKSRIADPANPSHVYSWLISESYDDKGNAIVYEYSSETSDGIDLSQTHERNRTGQMREANRYLTRIKYGNVASRLVQPDLGSMEWLFEVVFDYGEGHIEATTPGPQGEEFVDLAAVPLQPWPVRKDQFSSYRAGFEVRTYRLCRRVLTFHHFAKELGTPNYLVRSTDFTYDESPIASFITQIVQAGYVRRSNGTYLRKSLPALEFEYCKAKINTEVVSIDPSSLEHMPAGLGGGLHQSLDLEGEGLPGVLTEEPGSWFYKRNLSPLPAPAGAIPVARFSPAKTLSLQPSLSETATGREHFLDLAGDGQVDVVHFSDRLNGYYERTNDQNWAAFVAFASVPNINVDDPNVRFIDLTGDGHADLLVAEDGAFTWYGSLAEAGFTHIGRVGQPLDEEKGPRLVFADGAESIYLADLSGDGLTDLVRIRNGEVCYWPNLGYGRFGAKVTMDGAPWFDTPDLFEQTRIRLGDIDGSGTTDLFYLGRDEITIWRNESGNRWSAPVRLTEFPRIDTLSAVTVLDLLGNGTACLVWSSTLPGERRPMRYIDLMGGQKPHLLIGERNNLGAETQVSYVPSTKFYLADEANGRPWITRLPFPVHVVERVETYDRVSGNRFVTRYAYHHGYFDGEEREFRGFGMVEQLDTEEFAALAATGTLPGVTNLDQSSHVPPVLTRTWFHTGAFLAESKISKQFEHEYYREGDASDSWTGLADDELRALLLDDTLLPTSVRLPDGTRLPYALSTEEVREACRALKSVILRQEVYALDGTDKADRPYRAAEYNYTIELLQPRAGNQHAVFFTHERERVDFHYERTLVEVEINGQKQKRADPRLSHAMTLEVDPFGNMLRTAAIGYRRRELPGVDEAEQKQTHVTFAVNRFANRPDEPDWYRVGLPVETRTYEVVKPPEPTVTDTRIDVFRFEDVSSLTAALFPLDHSDPPAAALWPYEKWDWRRKPAEAPADAQSRLRLIEHVRTLYRRNDLTGPLALGGIQSLALPFESYKLAFPADLAQRMFVDTGKLTASALAGVLADEGKYVHREGDANWWIPSGRMFYSPGSNDTPAQELAHARTHFFLPHRFCDPFHTDQFKTETVVAYDVPYKLLGVETHDALGNTVKAQHDYRALAPHSMTDPNGNRSEVAFDALGLVVATAVRGKIGEEVGDLLEGFDPDPPLAAMQAFVADPRGQAASLLGKATTRIVYDVDRHQRSGQPPFAATLTRETHSFDPGGAQPKIQIGFSYSDGFGREIQRKIQAERGDAPQRAPNITLPSGDVGPGTLVRDASGELVHVNTPQRWVGTGRTVFNNKGKPVKQYEPFFSATHLYEDERDITDTGFSPILLYDPVERVVATLHPNHTWEKVVFDPWRQDTWDVNDTVTLQPQNDKNVTGFFVHPDGTPRLPTDEYLPTWHEARKNGQLGPDEKAAAAKATIHAGTPTIVHVDSLGRTFLAVAHNKFKYSDAPAADPPLEEFHRTRIVLDIEGNQREIIDAKDRIVMRYDYDMLGTRVHQASMEAGQRWELNDVAGKAIRAWDNRGFMRRMTYDTLRRPTGLRVTQNGAERLAERTVYGEDQGDADNHRTRVYQVFDGAGLVTSVAYDFKGNLRESRRELLPDYKTAVDWSLSPTTDDGTFTSSTSYDALNRPVTMTAPDGSVYRPRFNEANLLDKVDVNLRGATTATAFVTNIDYNAKGQRTRIEYANGAETTYVYDELTFRPVRLNTTRNAGGNGMASQIFQDPTTVQDLQYTYDPAGNITRIEDAALKTVIHDNALIEPAGSYTYDALYRLIDAKGREHIGQTAFQPNPLNGDFRDYPFVGHSANPNDLQALRNYTERYEYDAVGNFERLIHRAKNGDWTRGYEYDEASLLEQAKRSNRLSRTTLGQTTEAYTYDAHGSMLSMPHLAAISWDFENQLQRVDLGGVDAAYYIYDAAGQRVRKVHEHNGGTVEERIYLGGFEIYRKRTSNGLQLERETLHIMDDKQRIALVETKTFDSAAPLTPHRSLIRYQLGNHLGSASLELDDAAQMISYEEYHPYGSTSYQAVRKNVEVLLKRYRYTDKERDEETGFSYHGARYYAPWLGRWTTCDPSGMVDGVNVYAFVKNSPLVTRDSTGRQCDRTITSCNESEVDTLASTSTEIKNQNSSPVERHIDTLNDKQAITVQAMNEARYVEGYERHDPQFDATKWEQSIVTELRHTESPQYKTRKAVAAAAQKRQDEQRAERERASMDPPDPIPGLGDKLGEPGKMVIEGIAGGYLIRGGSLALRFVTQRAELYAISEGLYAGEAVGTVGFQWGAGITWIDDVEELRELSAPVSKGVPSLTYGEGYQLGHDMAKAGYTLSLGTYPSNVQYVGRTPGAYTLDRPWGWTKMYNAGVVRGALEAQGSIKFTSDVTSNTLGKTFALEVDQILSTEFEAYAWMVRGGRP